MIYILIEKESLFLILFIFADWVKFTKNNKNNNKMKIELWIEKESDLEKIDFHEEILSTGKLFFIKIKHKD